LLVRGTFLRVLNATNFAYAALGIPSGLARGEKGPRDGPRPPWNFQVGGVPRRRRASENRNSSKSR
jgi:hypothetical protein